MAYIDSLMARGKRKSGQHLAVLGYADELGNDAHNNELSALRAQHVQQHLVSSGFNSGDITLCVGKGAVIRNAAVGKDSYPQDRIVQIAVLQVVAKDKKNVPDTPAIERLKSVNIDEPVVFEKIRFRPNTEKLLPGSVLAMQELYEFMVANSTLSIGFICDFMPDPGAPQNLSFLRSRIVCEYLAAHGISRSRCTYDTYKRVGAARVAQRVQGIKANDPLIEIVIKRK